MHQLILLAQAQQTQGMTGSFVLVGMMFLVFWLLVWRPQAKEQERHDSFTKSLKKGDKVATASGLLGTIDSIDDKVVTLEIARNTKVRVLRRTIQSTEQDAISGEADATKSKDTSKDSDDGGDEASSDDGDDTKSKSKKKDKKQSEEW